ncbi:AraC family transcriptional regulator [Sellimonas caecigallum]|uniref:AraC family transcriptional regulator n=1 Tax=Sellimonas caecigallum TaxID=2592333 RepID=A0ABS7L5I2_9FIRM|nr:AraC family transcriptional regulator [Sellimonas caecigallum]MBY0758167.1 AraC family transcriptional regulator [Sellimonas caecigallum]
MEINILYDDVGFQCLDHIEHQTNDLYLTRCGIQACKPNYCWGPKLRPQYHMHFILDGNGFFEIDHHIYHLKKGQIFLIPPNTMSRYYADGNDPWTYAFISFQGNKASQYMEQAGFSASPYIRDCVVDPEEYAAIVRQMLKTHQLTITNELQRVSLLFSMFSKLTSSYHASDSSYIQKSHDYLPETYFEHALQYIHINYGKNIHIQDIADYIGITRSYLFYIFNKKLQMSPKKYLLNYRIEKAKTMLSSTDIFIKDIAHHVGYEDSLAFSKVFRNATGYSPSAYRNYKAGVPEKQ